MAVYPRLCGGTFLRRSVQSNLSGLSPPVRGNLCPQDVRRPVERSIPACAGEPRKPCATTSNRWVYPRLCGGTLRDLESRGMGGGLSPPVRGNPLKIA